MMHLGQKRFQIFAESGGQRRGQKPPLNFSVVFAVQGKIEQVVLGYELIEHIRRQHDGGRHRDAHAGKAARHAALAQQVAHKSQAARLAAQRPGADRAENWIPKA